MQCINYNISRVHQIGGVVMIIISVFIQRHTHILGTHSPFFSKQFQFSNHAITVSALRAKNMEAFIENSCSNINVHNLIFRKSGKIIQSLDHPRQRIWSALWNCPLSASIHVFLSCRSRPPKTNFLNECLLP